MTEEEAKTKWCPFVRVIENGSACAAHNRVQDRTGDNVRIPIAGKCIASSCMAWRWNEDWESSVHDPVAKTLTYKLKPKARVQGGCGLAGAVQ